MRHLLPMTCILAMLSPPVLASLVSLQNATADFSDLAPLAKHTVANAIDGHVSAFGTLFGWSLSRDGFSSVPSTAVFETQTDVGPGRLTVTLFMNHFNPGHLIRRFPLSATDDDGSTFADGLAVNGDISANWTVQTPPHPTSASPGA